MATKKKEVTTQEIETRDLIATVECSLLNVRQKPSLNADVVKTVKHGDILVAHYTKNEEWLAVEDGFVMAKFVSVQ